jgi:hypothetical protein
VLAQNLDEQDPGVDGGDENRQNEHGWEPKNATAVVCGEGDPGHGQAGRECERGDLAQQTGAAHRRLVPASAQGADRGDGGFRGDNEDEGGEGPSGIVGVSPTTLMTRTLSRATSASRARPVRKLPPERLSASSTGRIFTLTATKIRPVNTAAAPAAARKKSPQLSVEHPVTLESLTHLSPNSTQAEPPLFK